MSRRRYASTRTGPSTQDVLNACPRARALRFYLFHIRRGTVGAISPTTNVQPSPPSRACRASQRLLGRALTISSPHWRFLCALPKRRNKARTLHTFGWTIKSIYLSPRMAMGRTGYIYFVSVFRDHDSVESSLVFWGQGIEYKQQDCKSASPLCEHTHTHNGNDTRHTRAENTYSHLYILYIRMAEQHATIHKHRALLPDLFPAPRDAYIYSQCGCSLN